jgi:hypothetical protein
MDDGDFKNYPTSISEAVALKNNDNRLWSPRDILVRMLRFIDDGDLNPDALVICYTIPDEEDNCSYAETGFSMSGVGKTVAIGVLTRIANELSV